MAASGRYARGSVLSDFDARYLNAEFSHTLGSWWFVQLLSKRSVSDLNQMLY